MNPKTLRFALVTNAVITVVLLVLGAGRGSRGANAKPTAGKSDTAFTRAADVPADLARPPAVNAAPGTSAWSAAIKAARVERERALREGQFHARERVFLRKTVVVLEYRYLLNQLTDLDPAQLQRIRDLLLEREGILDDVFRAALRLGVHDQAEVTAEDAEQIRLVDQQIALTAGPDGAKVLTLLPLSRVMSFVQSAVSPLMYFADTPLSPAQQIQLGTLFAQVHFASGDTESKRMMLLPIDAAGGFHGVRLEMVREAQAFLSPAQLQVLDDQLRTTELSIRRPPPRAP